jgi:hypothetical protein
MLRDFPILIAISGRDCMYWLVMMRVDRTDVGPPGLDGDGATFSVLVWHWIVAQILDVCLMLVVWYPSTTFFGCWYGSSRLRGDAASMTISPKMIKRRKLATKNVWMDLLQNHVWGFTRTAKNDSEDTNVVLSNGTHLTPRSLSFARLQC